MTELLAGAFTGVTNAVTSIFSVATNASMGPYFVIGIGVSLVLAAVTIIKRLVWGA